MKKTVILLFCIALGCASSAQTITYSQHIAPILYANCTNCHHTGALAPFSLESYSDAYQNRIGIETNTGNRIMPPWPPDSKYSTFIHQRSLTDSQIHVIKEWVDNGAPEGDPKLTPPTPTFSNNSVLGWPDFTMTIPTYNVTSKTDDYRCFATPSGLTADKFITGIEPLPGNHKIVHHILIYYDTSGACQKLDDADPLPGYVGFGGVGSNSATLLGAWVPGSGPVIFPKGMGVLASKNGTFVLQIHYAPGSNGQSDNTSINFIYSKDASTLRQVYLVPILNHLTDMTNGPISIPANATRLYHEKYGIPGEFTLISVAPHMHLIGETMKVYTVTPQKDTVHLISIKNWDFHWQGGYMFPHPLHITKNTVLYADAFYDNTTSNPHNPSFPPKPVVAGESTLNEMMLCFFGFLPYQKGDENLDLDALTQLPAPSGISQNEENTFNLKLYPNPTQSNTNIVFNLQSSEMTNISIYDIDGKLVKNVLNEKLTDGFHSMSVDLSGFNPGQYFCRIQTDKSSVNEKFTVIK